MYNDFIETRCEKCKYHKALMCDADTVASFCNKKKCWCADINKCSESAIKAHVLIAGKKMCIFKDI